MQDVGQPGGRERPRDVGDRLAEVRPSLGVHGDDDARPQEPRDLGRSRAVERERRAVVRHDHGARVAARVARALVLAPHRTGGQAQFVPAPVPPQDTADPVELAMVWARAHLDEPISLDAWARAAGTSRRTFTRRFAARTGLSPVRWLLDQRVDRARELLETTDLALDRVAEAAGLGSAESLRHHFRVRLGTSPSRYRVEFGGTTTSRPDDVDPARRLAGRRR